MLQGSHDLTDVNKDNEDYWRVPSSHHSSDDDSSFLNYNSRKCFR